MVKERCQACPKPSNDAKSSSVLLHPASVTVTYRCHCPMHRQLNMHSETIWKPEWLWRANINSLNRNGKSSQHGKLFNSNLEVSIQFLQ